MRTTSPEAPVYKYTDRPLARCTITGGPGRSITPNPVDNRAPTRRICAPVLAERLVANAVQIRSFCVSLAMVDSGGSGQASAPLFERFHARLRMPAAAVGWQEPVSKPRNTVTVARSDGCSSRRNHAASEMVGWLLLTTSRTGQP
jgi:hypothetical protein